MKLSNKPAGLAGSLIHADPIKNGESVDARVTNRPISANSANAAYMFSLLQSIYDTSAQYLWNQPAANDVRIGDFVYLDQSSQRFERAVAKYILGGTVAESPAAAVWGVVTKLSGERADICISGLCEFKTTTNVYTSSPSPGVRYLSGTFPGEPTAEITYPHKSLGFLVDVESNGAVQFFVRQNLTTDSRMHDHKLYALSVAQISDTSLPGWLPAYHASFNGTAPPDALYGYNTAFLKSCGFPLLNALSSGLVWQRTDSDPLIGGVPNEFYRIDDRGIWWLSNAVTPWTTITNHYEQRLWLAVINAGYGIQDRVVTSLRATERSQLVVRQFPYGGEAVSGDLILDLNTEFDTQPVTTFASEAVERIQNQSLLRGAVVGGIKIDSEETSILASDYQMDGYHYGRVTFGDTSGIAGREVEFGITHLSGVEETVENDALGLVFPTGRSSSLLSQMNVPLSRHFDTLNVAVRFGILTTKLGSVPADAFSLAYRIIQRTENNNAAVLAFTDERQTLACDFSAVATNAAYSYYTAESARIAVHPGDILIVKMTASGSQPRVVILKKTAVVYLP
ncbi:hypothetical protein FACS189443_1770 [Planctomycetales bacterium]|nr:hypothetical protein FACS189443_1770 [Planctomycetales bacterium]